MIYDDHNDEHSRQYDLVAISIAHTQAQNHS